jgi:cytochrome c553
MKINNISSKARVLFGLSVSGALLALASAPAHAGDIALGLKKAETCAACHGKDGNTPIDPSYPKIAGQYQGFLVRALKDYKSGERKNAVMNAQAAQLSSADIDNLASYYASLPGSLKIIK